MNTGMVNDEDRKLRISIAIFAFSGTALMQIKAFNYNYASYRINSTSQCIFEHKFFFGGGNNLRKFLPHRDGNVTGAGTSAYTDEFVIGNFSENMNQGKTMRWFEYISSASPDADFYFKCDDHTGVNLTAICSYLTDIPEPSAYHYIGRTMSISGEKWSTSRCPEASRDVGECFDYMQGGFYGFSRILLQEIVTHSALYRHGHEDLEMGRLVAALPQKDIITWHNFDFINPLWCHMFRRKYIEVLSGRKGWLDGKEQYCTPK